MAPLIDDDYEISPGGIAVRLRRAEQDIEKKADKAIVEGIAKEIASLRKIVIGFMVTVAGSSVLVSLTLFATVGSQHAH